MQEKWHEWYLQAKKNPGSTMQGRRATPMSRDLVRIIRESSRLEGPGLSVSDHVSAIDARQAKALEFYLRACLLRLDQGL
jgi:hypothetical protein